MAKVTIEWNDDEVLRELGGFVSGAMTKTVADASGDAKQLEAPYAVTGNLINEIGFLPAVRTARGWHAEFLSGAEYTMAVNDGHHYKARDGGGAVVWKWWEGRHFMERAWARRLPLLLRALEAAGITVR